MESIWLRPRGSKFPHQARCLCLLRFAIGGTLKMSGQVEVLDLGFGVLTVPAGYFGRLLNEILLADAHYAAVAAEEDPDLTSQ